MNSMSKMALAAIAALSFAPLAVQAQEQSPQQCGPRADVVESLFLGYGETQQFSMINQGGESIMEVFANEASGGWSVVNTDTHGVTCFVSGGPAFYDTDDHPFMAVTPPTAPPLQQSCGPRAAIIPNLIEKYGESHQASMLNADYQSMTEIFGNESSGSWTALLTLSNGNSCMIGSGIGFEDLNGMRPSLRPNV